MRSIGSSLFRIPTSRTVDAPTEKLAPPSPELPRTHGVAPKSDRHQVGHRLLLEVPAVGAVLVGIAVPACATASAAEVSAVDATAELLRASAEPTSTATATATATATPRTDDERELVTKLDRYVNQHHQGNMRAAFDAFDRDHDGSIGRAELRSVLERIGVGNGFTRGYWVDGILERADTDRDGKLSWNELTALTQ